jgi:hypothetical protein
MLNGPPKFLSEDVSYEQKPDESMDAIRNKVSDHDDVPGKRKARIFRAFTEVHNNLLLF